MTRVLLLSDTHSFLDQNIVKYAKGVDEVWHAGDVGKVEVIDKLAQIKPLRGVYGNIDGREVRLQLPELLDFEVEGVRVHIRHIGGYPPRYAKGVADYLNEHPCDLFICGHSHILKVMRDQKRDLLHMNPGAAGTHGFHKQRTMLRFELDRGIVDNLEVIELLPRR